MRHDMWSLYPLMLQSRLYEEGIAKLWNDGLISGEMHLGTGEEAIIAGIVSQLHDGDAMALDHRGTAALLMRGVDPLLIVRELLGQPGGLCGGMGGHMHLFSKEHLAASSGIVGAEGPAAIGFALAAQYSRPGSISVAFFGEAAHTAIDRARSGHGPTFLHASCVHLEGHFLGFQLLRIVRDPLREMPQIAGPLTHSFLRRGGAALGERVAGLKSVLAAVLATLRDPRRDVANDPVGRVRESLVSDLERLQELENQIQEDVDHAMASVLAETSP